MDGGEPGKPSGPETWMSPGRVPNTGSMGRNWLITSILLGHNLRGTTKPLQLGYINFGVDLSHSDEYTFSEMPIATIE